MRKLLRMRFLWGAVVLVLILVVYSHHVHAAQMQKRYTKLKKPSAKQTASYVPQNQPVVKGSGYTSNFINSMYPQVEKVNASILTKRKHLLSMYQQYREGKQLSASQLAWLQQLANNYDVNNPNFKQNTTWQTLVSRVDIIPASLVIAQAANESAWGRSRFAKQANNYFGQHCYKSGCGIVPLRRNPGSRMEVAKFSSVQASIASYIHNLNTHGTYKGLRQMREKMRMNDKKLSGYQLAAGLERYSELDIYVKAIRSVISNYGLAKLDNTTA